MLNMQEDAMGYERSGRYYRDDSDRRFGGRDDYRDWDYRERGYQSPPSDYDEDRGFFDRAGDEMRSWFGDEEAERRRRWDERLRERDYERRYAPNGERRVYSEGGRFAEGFGRTGYRGAGDRFASDYYSADYGAGYGAGATMNWGLGAGREHDSWGQDPNYRAWRRRQMDALDRDYDEYRRENEQRFHKDFGSWRSNRMNQRESLRHVQEHQEVLGSDGAHIGTVDHVRGDHILLTKSDKDAAGHHHSIPCSWITDVGDKVKVNRTAAQAKQAWKEEEMGEGPHMLNRAFAGTY
jgi:hypothetical protein